MEALLLAYLDILKLKIFDWRIFLKKSNTQTMQAETKTDVVLFSGRTVKALD